MAVGRSIQEFAALRAEGLRTGDLDAVVEAAGMHPADWAELEDHWQSALAREAAAGRRELEERYLAAFARYSDHGPSAASADAKDGSPGLPTYLIAQQPQGSTSLRVAPAEPPTPAAPVLRPGLPVLSIEQYAWVTATLSSATPAELPAALARLRLTPETRTELDLAWKTFFDADSAARNAFMLALGRQFETRASQPAATTQPAAASLPRATVAVSVVMAPNPDETQLGGSALRPALPFAPDVSPAGAPKPAPVARTAERSPLAGRTAFGSSGARPSLPFARGKGPNLPDLPAGWTLARYAALSFDLHGSGMPAEEVLRVAGITRTQQKALDAYWENRMFEEPSLRAEWKAFADARQAEFKR